MSECSTQLRIHSMSPVQQRYDVVALDGQAAPCFLVVLEEQVIDEVEDLHDVLILLKVLVTVSKNTHSRYQI